MSLFTPPIISIFTLLFVAIGSLFLVFFLYKFNQKLNELTHKRQTDELIIQELQTINEELKKQQLTFQKSANAQLLESSQVMKQLEHRIKSQQAISNNLQQLIENIQDNQEQDKLYSRAFKLAEKGADIDEIVKECELPIAEAEMLLSVHRQRTIT
ncbi:DUF2802 domain-containing protein [Colwellia sp. D2M02]|uniref:DUF2802 domain-containing protein n=1 Tax=Colwellia sp. D2M02 TaxID=2841562 RepID=UPI001C08650C|nr:DUF2802 domain-containing protein [Colwellia sp. D2M02]MBU2893220.1 DUF2802 domain-containing protein [Colwellia sp. D2M02]